MARRPCARPALTDAGEAAPPRTFGLARRVIILPGMFCVSEAEAAAIRTAYEQGGEFSAAIELRRLFPGITDNAKARECARTIAGWTPLPASVSKVPQRRSQKDRPSRFSPAGR